MNASYFSKIEIAFLTFIFIATHRIISLIPESSLKPQHSSTNPFGYDIQIFIIHPRQIFCVNIQPVSNRKLNVEHNFNKKLKFR